MQRVLQNKTFLKLWIGNLASGFGDVLYDVAVVWYITEKTGSATKAGGVALAVMLKHHTAMPITINFFNIFIAIAYHQ